MDSTSRSSAALSAFLFTDIEGSSVRWLNHRAAMEKASVHAIFGEQDAAVEIVAVVTAIPGGPSYADLELGYAGDSRPGDPRFDAMVEMRAPKEPQKCVEGRVTRVEGRKSEAQICPARRGIRRN